MLKRAKGKCAKGEGDGGSCRAWRVQPGTLAVVVMCFLSALSHHCAASGLHCWLVLCCLALHACKPEKKTCVTTQPAAGSCHQEVHEGMRCKCPHGVHCRPLFLQCLASLYAFAQVAALNLEPGMTRIGDDVRSEFQKWKNAQGTASGRCGGGGAAPGHRVLAGIVVKDRTKVVGLCFHGARCTPHLFSCGSRCVLSIACCGAMWWTGQPSVEAIAT